MMRKIIALILSLCSLLPSYGMRISSPSLAKMPIAKLMHLTKLTQSAEFPALLNKTEKDIYDLRMLFGQMEKEKNLFQSRPTRLFAYLEQKSFNAFENINKTARYMVQGNPIVLFLWIYMMPDVGAIFTYGITASGLAVLSAYASAKIGHILCKAIDQKIPKFAQAQQNRDYLKQLLEQANTASTAKKKD